MKTFAIFVRACSALLLSFCSAAWAYPTFSAGQTITYQFDPQFNPLSGPTVYYPGYGWFVGGMFTVYGDFSGPCSYKLEMFENNVNEKPIAAQSFSQVNSSAQIAFVPAWQDLQGAVRLSVLSGSLSVENAWVYLGIGVAPARVYYGNHIELVPEPSTRRVIGLGLFGVILWRRKGTKQ